VLVVTIASLRATKCEVVDKDAKDANSLKTILSKQYLPFATRFRQASWLKSLDSENGLCDTVIRRK
jgi:hypothetical protein